MQILLADDDQPTLETFKAYLGKLGYEVVTAQDGERVWQILQEPDCPQVAVLDWVMPGMEAPAICKRVREYRTKQDLGYVYIIVLTAHIVSKDNVVEAIQAGADDYLEKPCNFKELGMRIRAGERLIQAYAELQESRVFYQAIFKNNQEAMLLIDPDTAWIIDANSAACSFYKYRYQDLLQKSLSQINELRSEECLDKLRQIASGQRNRFQCKHRLGDGQIRDVEVFSGPLLVQGKDVVYATVHDITDKLHAEANLRQALQETSSLVESISSILISLDREERVYRWNQAAASTFGLSKSEVQGRPIMECPVNWEKEVIRHGLQQCRQSRDKIALEDVSYVLESQVTGFLSFSIQPILEQDSKELSGFLLLGTDITEQKVMESQFLQAQKLEAIGQLAAGIAHEINTPVQYIESNTTYLQDSFSSILDFLSDSLQLAEQAQQGAVQPELLQKIQSSRQELDLDFLREDIPDSLQESLEGLKKVTRIVRSMKDFSHPGENEKAQVDLNKALEDTLTISRNEWKYWAEVETELDPELPLVPCLKDEINQVFLNIIINAAQALSEQQEKGGRQGKGKIYIGTRKNGQMAEIKIMDNGPGIPENIRSRIFDPFFTTKAVGKGSGQGLYISYDIVVEKHKGRLFCESDADSGTTFIIHLPLQEGGE